MKNKGFLLTAAILGLIAAEAGAAPMYWTDWTGGDLDPGSGFKGEGTITTPTSSVDVTYTNANGIGFYQPSGGADYWANRGGGRDDSISPYTSSEVDNSPTGTDIIALSRAGSQVLNFSESIANPVFAFVSLNGNGYAFDRDFDIISVGGEGGNACGYWGCGGVTKQVIDVGGGNFEYQLNSSNVGGTEPHGAIRFKGAFETVTWRSQSNEYWNGFTVGVQGTAQEVLLGDITGVKWEDLDGDGVRDINEPGLAGWTIELLDEFGNLVGDRITGSDGSYEFLDLLVGDYSVGEVMQPGWEQTFNGGGAVSVIADTVITADFGNRRLSSPPPTNVPVAPTLLLIVSGLFVMGIRHGQRQQA